MLWKPPISVLPAWCVGVVASFALPYTGSAWQWACSALLLLLAMRRWPLWQHGLWALLGMLYALWRVQLALSGQVPPQLEPSEQNLTVRVSGLTQVNERSHRFEAQVLAGDTRARRLVLSDYRMQDWPIGSVWQIHTRLRSSVGVANPAGFNSEAWALSRGLDGFGNVQKGRRWLRQEAGVAVRWQQWRAELRGRILDAGQAHPHGAALISALALGEQAGLAPELWQHFRALGITHLVSISGLHVSMVGLLAAMLVAACCRLLRVRLPQPRLVLALIGCAAALFYAVLAGFSVPTQRSVLMLAVICAGWCSRRYLGAWQVWWWALAAVLLWDPLAVLGIGFWLSFGLVAALLWFEANRLRRTAQPWWRLLARSQYAAAVASLVPVAYVFGGIPLLSPLANLVAIPWFSWLLTPLALLGLLSPWDGVLQAACALAEQTLALIRWWANHAPVWSVAQAPLALLALALVATALWLLPRGLALKPWSLLLMLMLVLYQPPRPPAGTLHVTVWDVGQGLSVLLQTRQRQLLFDTGRADAERVLLPNLRAAGVRHLDALVLSHPDNDHDGAWPELQAALPVDVVWAGVPSAYPSVAVQSCRAANWQWDGVYFEWLTLPESTAWPDNDRSCVLRVIAGQQALLLTGDLSQAGEAALLHTYGADVRSNVLVLGHHGSKTASGEAFLQTVAPEWAVVSAGFANSFHHPHPTVLARLRQQAIAVWRTDRMGALQLHLGQTVQAQPALGWTAYWQRKPFPPD